MENPLCRSKPYFSGQKFAHPKKLASLHKYDNILLRNTVFCCFEVILFLTGNLQKIFCFQITLSTFGNISQKKELLVYNIGMSTGIEEVWSEAIAGVYQYRCGKGFEIIPRSSLAYARQKSVLELIPVPDW